MQHHALTTLGSSALGGMVLTQKSRNIPYQVSEELNMIIFGHYLWDFMTEIKILSDENRHNNQAT